MSKKINSYFPMFLMVIGCIICLVGIFLLMFSSDSAKGLSKEAAINSKEITRLRSIFLIFTILFAFTLVVILLISIFLRNSEIGNIIILCGNILLVGLYIGICIMFEFNWIILIGLIINIASNISGLILFYKRPS